MEPDRSGADRWVRALHNLYLATLPIAFVATLLAEPLAPQWSASLRASVAGAATVGLAAADIAMRRWVASSPRRAALIGYFLVVSTVLAVMTVVIPLFWMVAFGAIPLIFVLLPRPAALVLGIALTGLPMVIDFGLTPLLFPDRRPFGFGYRGGPLLVGVESVAVPVLFGLFIAAAIHAVVRQSQLRQALVDQLSATRAELATASRLAGRAEERQRLAHELHDTLAQGLSGVIIHLQAAEQHVDGQTSGGLSASLARAHQTAGACLADTRRAVEALRPEPLDDRTLVDAVAHVCEQWTRTTELAATATVRGTTRRFHPHVEVAALRVTQEALANAAKHAAPGSVTVTVDYHDDGLRLSIRDDGHGFNPTDLPPPPNGHTSTGFGLAVMRERVVQVGGTLTVHSAPGRGTTVTAVLPPPDEVAP